MREQVDRAAKFQTKWKALALAGGWLVGLVLLAKREPTALQLYISISIIILIARNLGQRREGLSAYSVFNKGFTPLLGQLRPDQFENEIRHRPVDADLRDSGPTIPRVEDPDEILQNLRAEMRRDARRTKRAFEANSGQGLRSRRR